MHKNKFNLKPVKIKESNYTTYYYTNTALC